MLWEQWPTRALAGVYKAWKTCVEVKGCHGDEAGYCEASPKRRHFLDSGESVKKI
jgi:hypothetical protein